MIRRGVSIDTSEQEEERGGGGGEEESSHHPMEIKDHFEELPPHIEETHEKPSTQAHHLQEGHSSQEGPSSQ